jgi:hypothetical protein
MKKISLLLIACSLFTGCAQVMYGYGLMGSVDYAKTECSKMGLTENTPKYNQCVETTASQLRASRAQQQTYSTSRSSTITCQPWLNGVRCTEF